VINALVALASSMSDAPGPSVPVCASRILYQMRRPKRREMAEEILPAPTRGAPSARDADRFPSPSRSVAASPSSRNATTTYLA
jgi:hypothetical protein